ncbi:low affinity immunoglobulin epsilon Fc receptor [Choloepus didactylus]|uniref:low affinity immunoglobulin epsilon Fc receptor n=1 Tax=Choloepus didactylus TaxID=27675 RepID=UPI0018A1180B|nr:low affinity immunoglobulin epsilon Fc receptor [Choloepus didactylus]
MEENPYTDVANFSRKQRCRQGTQLVLLGLGTAALWAVLLTLLLLWHWDTAKNLKQLEETAARNVSQVSRNLERHKSQQLGQESQAAKMAQNMEKIQVEQETMKSQDSELSWNLDGLRADLTNFKSLSLNEKRTVVDLLEKLQEDVAKLRIELQELNGSKCTTCPENWVNFQKKCYYFGEGAKTWIEARYTCEDLQGRLVSIHSLEEQAFLTKHADMKGSWIGLRDLNVEGEFIWMDGSPVDYSNWQLGEPNNQAQGEDCVMMLGSGKWNDAFCRSKQDGWVCDQLVTC